MDPEEVSEPASQSSLPAALGQMMGGAAAAPMPAPAGGDVSALLQILQAMMGLPQQTGVI